MRLMGATGVARSGRRFWLYVRLRGTARAARVALGLLCSHTTRARRDFSCATPTRCSRIFWTSFLD